MAMAGLKEIREVCLAAAELEGKRMRFETFGDVVDVLGLRASVVAGTLLTHDEILTMVNEVLERRAVFELKGV